MSSSDYWRKREKAWLKECQAEEKDWAAEIQTVYETMEREISDEVSLFVSRYAKSNEMTMAEAREYLSKSDMKELAQKAKYYCKLAALDMQEGTDKRASEYFSEQANAEMSRYNTTMRVSRLEMLQSQIRLRVAKAQGKILDKTQEKLLKRAEKTYQKMAGILGNTVLDNLDRAKTIVQASFHGATFSKRIWGDQQAELKKRLETALRTCLIQGKGMAPFTRKLAKEAGVAKSKAQRLLTTELARVQIQTQEDCLDAMEIEDYEFIASSDCCPICAELNGKHFDRKEGREQGKLPPMHPNCRCSIAPYIEREDDDGFDEKAFDEWADTFDQHGLSWQDWKAQKLQEQKTASAKKTSTKTKKNSANAKKKTAKAKTAKAASAPESKKPAAKANPAASPKAEKAPAVKATKEMYDATKNAHSYSWEKFQKLPEKALEFFSGYKPLAESTAMRKLTAHGKQWGNRLSEDQQSSINSYSDWTYDILNSALRDTTGRQLRDLPDYWVADISNIKNAIKEAGGAPCDFIAHRSQSTDIFRQDKVGDTGYLRGFTSTSAVEGHELSGRYHIKILVPEGARGAFIKSLAHFKNEDEFLLDESVKYILLEKKAREYTIGILPD